MDSNSKPVGIDAVDVENPAEFERFMKKVLADGDKRLHAQVQEAIRMGIIDEKGNLLKHDLPEDMREDADRDFGG